MSVKSTLRCVALRGVVTLRCVVDSIRFVSSRFVALRCVGGDLLPSFLAMSKDSVSRALELSLSLPPSLAR